MILSVIVPIYNMERYLNRCLDSLIIQKLYDMEIILVDDGSTDKSAEICRQYTEVDNRFVYIYQANSWVSTARNKGISHAKGSYITFLDADDYVEPDYCLKIIEAMSASNSDILLFSFYYENTPTDKQIIYISDLDEEIDINDTMLLGYFSEYWLRRRKVNYVWNKAFKKALLLSSGVLFCEDLRFYEDRCFMYELLPYIKKVSYIKEPLYHYCQNNDSMCYTTGKNINLMYEVIKVYYLSLSKDGQDFWAKMNSIQSVIWLRMMQSAFYATLQAGVSMKTLANNALEAISILSDKELSPVKIYEDILNYSKICGLRFEESMKELMFALSLLRNEEAICEWQDMYHRLNV